MFVERRLFIFHVNRTTNDDGRCPGLITKEMFTSGVYRIRFETAKYWERMGEACFYPYVEVRLKLSFIDLHISYLPFFSVQLLHLLPHLQTGQ